jgi:hypothetical protein
MKGKFFIPVLILLAMVMCLPTWTSSSASGTLAYHLSTNAAAYAQGRAGNDNDKCEVSGWNYQLFVGHDFYLLTNVVWSTNFWLAGVQGLSATPIGISNSLGGQGLITMVSPRHYLHAHHMGSLYDSRKVIVFLDTNNIVYLRTSLQEVQVGNSDTDVGILNADVPPSVGFLPVIPANYADYLPTNGYIQGIGMNQGMALFGQPMVLADPLVIWNSQATVPFGLTANWNVLIRGGDSSNPEMLLIGNQLVLVSHNFYVQAGPNYAVQFDAINQQMHYLSTNNNIGTDYQLTPYSMANWPAIR